MRVAPVFLCLLCLLQATAAAVEIPQPIFYLPLEGSTTAALAAGSPVASFAAQRDPILSLVESRRNKFTPGQVGLCYDVNDAPLAFACDHYHRRQVMPKGSQPLPLRPRLANPSRSPVGGHCNWHNSPWHSFLRSDGG